MERSGAPIPRRLLELLVIAAVTTFVLLLYSPSFSGPFVFDDKNILRSPDVRLETLEPSAIVSAARNNPHPRRWVAYVSFALNYYVHGEQVLGYRVVNVLIHVTSGVIIFYLIGLILRSAALRGRHRNPRAIAFAAAMVWLVHPLATQSVAYVVQRMNGLATLFYLLSLLLYALGREASASTRRRIFFGGFALSGVLSLGSKELAATLPIFILLYEWYFYQDLSTEWIRRSYRAVVVATGTVGVISMMFLGANPLRLILNGYSVRDFSLMERLLTEGRVVLSYLGLLVLPHPSRLSLERVFPISHSLFSPPTTVLAILVIMAALGLALWLARRERLLSFCVLWFFGNLAIEGFNQMAEDASRPRKWSAATCHLWWPGDTVRSARCGRAAP